MSTIIPLGSRRLRLVRDVAEQNAMAAPEPHLAQYELDGRTFLVHFYAAPGQSEEAVRAIRETLRMLSAGDEK